VHRLGSMLARVKLKGIDGGPHKRWSMWFNSMIREEPYQGLTCAGQSVRTGFPARDLHTGAAWLSSARVVRCWVKSRNERNPHCLLPTGRAGHSDGTAGDKPEEGGDDVKSSWPLCPGLHTCYNGRYSALRNGDVEPIAKSRSQFGLESETRLHEVGIASNRASAWRGEYVPGPCTHRPSHHPSWGYPKSLA
jgi:hypothetical protein